MYNIVKYEKTVSHQRLSKIQNWELRQ